MCFGTCYRMNGTDRMWRMVSRDSSEEFCDFKLSLGNGANGVSAKLKAGHRGKKSSSPASKRHAMAAPGWLEPKTGQLCDTLSHSPGVRWGVPSGDTFESWMTLVSGRTIRTQAVSSADLLKRSNFRFCGESDVLHVCFLFLPPGVFPRQEGRVLLPSLQSFHLLPGAKSYFKYRLLRGRVVLTVLPVEAHGLTRLKMECDHI